MRRTGQTRSVEQVLGPVLSGQVAPGSVLGKSLIGEALRIDPDRTVERVRDLDPTALRETMRAMSMPQERVADLLGARTRIILDPFGTAPDPDTTGAPFPTPGEIMSRGPARSGAG